MDDSQETEPQTESPTELESLQTELEAAQSREREAVARLRAALAASEPALEETLITGDTVEEVEASFAAARALVARIRERAAAESSTRIPAGAPGRLEAKPRTAFEKIREGLGRGA